MTAIDCFSQYVWAFAHHTKEAEEVVISLLTIFNIYTPPSILHSDNGGEFIAEVVDNLCTQCDVKIINGGPYHPQSQGRVERFNQTLQVQLGKTLTERKSKRWVDELPKITRSYNNTVHEVTNRTPFEALHGWKPSTIKPVVNIEGKRDIASKR